MKNVIIYGGMGKAASSSFRDFFNKSSYLHSARGGDEELYDFIHLNAILRPFYMAKDELFKEFDTLIDNCSSEIIIISHTDIFFNALWGGFTQVNSIEFFRKLVQKSHHRISFLVTYRKISDFIESLYPELIQSGLPTVRAEDFLNWDKNENEFKQIYSHAVPRLNMYALNQSRAIEEWKSIRFFDVQFINIEKLKDLKTLEKLEHFLRFEGAIDFFLNSENISNKRKNVNKKLIGIFNQISLFVPKTSFFRRVGKFLLNKLLGGWFAVNKRFKLNKQQLAKIDKLS